MMSAGSSKDAFAKNNEVYEWIAQLQRDPVNEELQTKIVAYYTPLVKTLANKFSKGKDIQEDLVQVGMIGLLAAVKRYDPSFEKSFEAFAVPTIIGEIKRYIRDKTWSVHVPRRIKELGPKIKRAIEHLTEQLERSPKVEEIADYLGVSEEEILETMEMGKSYQALSVDSAIESDQDGSTVTLLDIVGHEEQGYEQTDRMLLLNNAFKTLTERERLIIQYTYFDQKSQKETGDALGISQMHVSRLQRRALEKLRKAIHLELSEAL